jgi:hypothetical protein
MRLAVAFTAVLALCGCATTADLATGAAAATWQFQSDYNSVSECLVRSLNHEWQPKTSVAAFWGRSISHQIATIEPGRVNHVTHEHIGPSAIWMFVVARSEPNRATASAHVLDTPVGREALETMRLAAASCGGIPA